MTITRNPLITDLERRRDQTKYEAGQLLRAAKAQGRETLTASEDQRFNTMTEQIKGLEERIGELKSEDERAGDPHSIIKAGKYRTVNTAGQIAQLRFPDSELRRMQTCAE
jgi:hypothetical protein